MKKFKFHLFIVTAFLLLIVTGCIERKETFEVDKNGNLTIESTFKGDYIQFDKYIALPQEPDWTITQYSIDSTKDEPTLSLKASKTIKYGDNIPFTYAKKEDKKIDRHLMFPTEIKKWQDGKRTFYEFKRTYQARDYMHFHGPEDMQIEEELEQRVLEQGIFNVSETDRNQYASGIGMQFAVLHFFQLNDLLGEMVINNQLTIEQKRIIEPQAMQYLEEKLTTEYVLELLSKEDSTLELDHDELIEEIRNQFATLTSKATGINYSDRNSAFWKHYHDVIFKAMVTEKLNSHTFQIFLKLPGEIVSTNGITDASETGMVVWEFKGENLHDADIPLRALSVVENK